MSVHNLKDAATQAILLAAARELLAQDANFSLKTLLIKTGVSQTEFGRCFANQEELLAALTSESVKALDDILDAAQPASLAQEQSASLAVGSDIVPAPVINDAWLERRLRVFERALAALEKRQEKSEAAFDRRLALIEEKVEALMAARDAAIPAEPQIAVFAPAPAEPAGIQSEEAAATEPAPVLQIAAEPEPEPAAEPVGEKEIYDFIAQARRAAQNAAAEAKAAPPRRLNNLRWLAWSGATLLTLTFCAGILFASGARGHSKPAQPVLANSGVARRQVAKSGIARVMALADSGDANAQTALALDYLRGNGVSADGAAARRWSLAAASQGQPVAQYMLGALYQEDNSDAGEAVRWLKAAAGQGNLKAMHNLAIAYAEGSGVEKDSTQAVQWFARAADEGYRDSQFDLAVLYERGEGVQQSARSALKWYLIAAGSGDAPSAARAATLKNQVDPMESRLAAADAAAFEPKPMAYSANEVPDF